EACQRTKASCDRDAEVRRVRIHAERHLRHYTDAEGAGHLHLRDNPEVVAEVMAAIAPKREELFKRARAEGRRERPDALDADALVATVCDRSGSTGDGQPVRSTAAKILVRIDFDTLLRGHPVDGETCEIVGYGPVAVSAVEEM